MYSHDQIVYFTPFLTVGRSNQIQQVCWTLLLAMNINIVRLGEGPEREILPVSRQIGRELIKRNTSLQFR